MMIYYNYVADFYDFVPEEFDYQYLYDIFKYVTQELGQEAIIVEADDLQNNPGII